MIAWVIKSEEGYLLDEDSWDYTKHLERAFFFSSKRAAENNMEKAKEGHKEWNIGKDLEETLVKVEIKEV